MASGDDPLGEMTPRTANDLIEQPDQAERTEQAEQTKRATRADEGDFAAPVEVCALAGCEIPLPARGLDEQGRPKGGRRPQYCGKPHADLASRQRKARDLESVADPLALARAAGETFLPSARQLAGQLTDLIARFDQAEAGALGRVRAAEQDAAQAQADAVVAREAADVAEQGRRQALAQARQDRQARDNAVKEAERARQDSEQIRTGAWEQVVGHERARGHAEAARTAAETTAAGLVAQNRRLGEQLGLARATSADLTQRLADLTQRLADRAQELERSRGENLALSARIETVEQLRAQEADRLREQVLALERQATQAQTGLVAERSKTVALEQASEQLRAQITGHQQQALTLQTQLAAERLARQGEHADQAELAAARRALRHHDHQRRRRRAGRETPPATDPVPPAPAHPQSPAHPQTPPTP